MTIARTITPAIASAWESVFVAAAIVRKTADIVKVATKLKRKKMKNCEGSVLSPLRK